MSNSDIAIAIVNILFTPHRDISITTRNELQEVHDISVGTSNQVQQIHDVSVITRGELQEVHDISVVASNQVQQIHDISIITRDELRQMRNELRAMCQSTSVRARNAAACLLATSSGGSGQIVDGGFGLPLNVSGHIYK